MDKGIITTSMVLDMQKVSRQKTKELGMHFIPKYAKIFKKKDIHIDPDFVKKHGETYTYFIKTKNENGYDRYNYLVFAAYKKFDCPSDNSHCHTTIGRRRDWGVGCPCHAPELASLKKHELFQIDKLGSGICIF